MRTLRRLAVILLLSASCWAQTQVQPTFFGMHFNRMTSFPTTIPIGSLRLWGTGTAWTHLCPTGPNCNWDRLDKWLATAKSNGISDVVYTFGKVPGWIAAYPPANPKAAAWGVFPPRDLTPDGGGSDDAWKGFVKAIVQHNQHLDSSHAKIRYWGIWNEPGGFNFWKGTDAQMVRMEKDASAIIKAADPSALVLTPEAGTGPWFDHYFAAGGGRYADVVAFHGYIAAHDGNPPLVEEIVDAMARMRTKMAPYPELARKPVWDSEGSWANTKDTNWQGWDQAVAYVVRFYVLQASLGIERVYWYMYDGNPKTCCGSMWSAETGELPTAAAYKEVHKWLLGRTVSPCSAQGHVWSCSLEGAGYKGKIVWDNEYEKTASYDATGFASYRDISGTVTPFGQKTHTVTIGNKPVLLEMSGK